MAMNRARNVLAVLMLAAAAGWPAAEAGARDRDRGGAAARAERAISLDEAVARAERRYEARAIRAEEKRHGDRIEYRIRLLTADGRVFEVRVDAETGRER